MKKLFFIVGIITMISCTETTDMDELLVDGQEIIESDTVVVYDTVYVADTVSNVDTEVVEDTTVTDYIISSLQLMREEEKLARDVYTFLFDKWNQSIFENIASSEQKHTDAVKGLLDQYGIEDPVTTDVPGQFEDELLQYLYDSLTELGSESLESALRVGALVEEVDINDLNIAVAQITNESVLAVYANLTKGSRNHLRSFYGNLEIQGVEYEPQVLDEEYFEEIVNSEMETGGNGNGNGHGG